MEQNVPFGTMEKVKRARRRLVRKRRMQIWKWKPARKIAKSKCVYGWIKTTSNNKLRWGSELRADKRAAQGQIVRRQRLQKSIRSFLGHPVWFLTWHVQRKSKIKELHMNGSGGDSWVYGRGKWRAELKIGRRLSPRKGFFRATHGYWRGPW